MLPSPCFYAVMCHLVTEIYSEKCVIRRSRHYVNITECTCPSLDGTAYCTPRLYGTACCSSTNLYGVLLYWISQAIISQWYMFVHLNISDHRKGTGKYMKEKVKNDTSSNFRALTWMELPKLAVALSEWASKCECECECECKGPGHYCTLL